MTANMDKEGLIVEEFHLVKHKYPLKKSGSGPLRVKMSTFASTNIFNVLQETNVSEKGLMRHRHIDKSSNLKDHT